MSFGNIGNEHPFLDINNIKEQLTLEEIQAKIKSLIEKLNYAYQIGNQQMINQLEMMRATYTRAHQEKLEELFGNDKDQNVEGKIDIS